MTVKADITSTLNGQTAELLLVEDSPNGTRKQQSRSLSGGTEELVFTSLDGGRDKRYTAKVIPSTTDVTQTSEIPYGAEIRIDPIPHRDSDATQKIRDGVEFNNGVAASQLGLGSSPLVSGLLTAALNDGEVLADDGSVHVSVQAAQDAASSYIFIGPGTFNEAVTVDTANITIRGSGYDSIIDAGTDGNALNITSSGVTIMNVRPITSTSGSDTAVYVDSSDVTLMNISITRAGGRGVFSPNSGHSNLTIIDSFIENTVDEYNILSNHIETIISGCQLIGYNALNGHDSLFSKNVCENQDNTSSTVYVNTCDDSVIIGNRMYGNGSESIKTTANDTIIANNRASDGISNEGTGTVLDGNNTGSAN